VNGNKKVSKMQLTEYWRLLGLQKHNPMDRQLQTLQAESGCTVCRSACHIPAVQSSDSEYPL